MRRVCLIIGLIFFTCCLSRQVWAFVAAPAVIDISGNRGEALESKFTLVNNNEKEETYYFSTLRFEAEGESGSPKFIPFNQDHSELPEWISFENSALIVPAKSFVEVPFSVAIPTDIKSGGYYAAITISNSQPPTDASVPTVQAQTAILVFLNVKGENNEQAALLDFSALKILWQTTGTLTYRIQNQGNVYLKPEGTIILKDIFGRTVATVDANPEGNRAMTGTTRKIETPFQTSWAIGPITAELNLTYGDQQKELSDSVTFWILPWKILSILLTVVIVIVIVTIKKKKMCAR